MTKLKFPTIGLLILLLVSVAPLTASAPLSASASAAPVSKSIKVQSMNVKMFFDNVDLQPPAGQYVFAHNNAIYVPLRFISNALQKSVSWDAKNMKVTVAEPTSSELVLIKEYLMNSTSTNPLTTKIFTVSDLKASYVFNGKSVTVLKGQSSYMLNGTVYVPLRFLSESVGRSINWDQKTKTITANSSGEQTDNGNEASTPSPGQTATPNVGGSGSVGSGKVSYESITSETESKLNSLRTQSQSTLMGIALEYVAAKDATSKQNIKARGLQQLSAFTASFNGIVSAAEQQLISNGYSTDIIQQYRSTFEAELQAGKDIAEGMSN
ncbi:copper amine oxidase N-terminal domain-containing protein [Paenibacillus sp. FSL L8-0463]|uniref:copper amine oxidase N-terminal domain-containing protein n=1 Tax=Paenibacillus sp. FSL L8-0463 TaxID=2954687 RepID=UPI003119D0C5